MRDRVAAGRVLAAVVEVVTAYLSRNAAAPSDLPKLIQGVHEALAGDRPTAPTPAVAIRKSVTSDYIVCLEDGRRLKTLRRHLGSAHGLTPQEYRTRWGLPAHYPVVAPNYREVRSRLGKQLIRRSSRGSKKR